MVRALKPHEKKLLRKVDFLKYKNENNLRVVEVLRRYHIQRREDYTKYNKICGQVKKITTKLSALHPRDPFRSERTQTLLSKLYNSGLITNTKSLVAVDKLTASSFCRRRLPVVMVRLRMAETVKKAVEMVEQGHVRVGPQVVLDPAFLVTRPMEDFVTWVDSSKIRRHVDRYNDKLDDFDLL